MINKGLGVGVSRDNNNNKYVVIDRDTTINRI